MMSTVPLPGGHSWRGALTADHPLRAQVIHLGCGGILDRFPSCALVWLGGPLGAIVGFVTGVLITEVIFHIHERGGVRTGGGRPRWLVTGATGGPPRR